MKEFADDNFKFDENGKKLSKGVENTVGKGEIARYEQFLLFPQCFQKACFPGASKGVVVWEWVNSFKGKKKKKKKKKSINFIFVLWRLPVHLSMLSWTLFLPELRTMFFPSQLLLFHITIAETMNRSERGIDLPQ